MRKQTLGHYEKLTLYLTQEAEAVSVFKMQHIKDFDSGLRWIMFPLFLMLVFSLTGKDTKLCNNFTCSHFFFQTKSALSCFCKMLSLLNT